MSVKNKLIVLCVCINSFFLLVLYQYFFGHEIFPTVKCGLSAKIVSSSQNAPDNSGWFVVHECSKTRQEYYDFWYKQKIGQHSFPYIYHIVGKNITKLVPGDSIEGYVEPFLFYTVIDREFLNGDALETYTKHLKMLDTRNLVSTEIAELQKKKTSQDTEIIASTLVNGEWIFAIAPAEVAYVPEVRKNEENQIDIYKYRPNNKTYLFSALIPYTHLDYFTSYIQISDKLLPVASTMQNINDVDLEIFEFDMGYIDNHDVQKIVINRYYFNITNGNIVGHIPSTTVDRRAYEEIQRNKEIKDNDYRYAAIPIDESNAMWTGHWGPNDMPQTFIDRIINKYV